MFLSSFSVPGVLGILWWIQWTQMGLFRWRSVLPNWLDLCLPQLLPLDILALRDIRMPILFHDLCDLLSALECVAGYDIPLIPALLHQKHREVVQQWFSKHQVSIHSSNIDPTALLSAIFPAKRTDRVYSIQPPRLTKILKRCLSLGTSRSSQLDQWQKSGRGDLSNCVERVLQAAENPLPHFNHRVTLEEVDASLAIIASRCRFSGPNVRVSMTDNDAEVLQRLESIYKRLQSREAKWLTRMILKDFSCLSVKESTVYYHLDPRLPFAMQMYDNFEAAITELRRLPFFQITDADQGNQTQPCVDDACLLSPKVGVKVGPPRWIKAKGGIKHAVNVIGGRMMSIERKHDGEYCQVHIDLSKGDNCIQIFSKSGKDSTLDRSSAHESIKKGLRIGQSDCAFSGKCILEGELLVWSDKTNQILEFHKIRKQ